MLVVYNIWSSEVDKVINRWIVKFITIAEGFIREKSSVLCVVKESVNF